MPLASISKLKKKFFRKKILIVGLGLQGGGVGLAKFFLKIGAKVTITDKKTEEELKKSIFQLKKYSVKYVLRKHNLKDFLTSDFIFKGPSVPWTLSQIKIAKEKKIPILMEASFFVKNSPAKIIAVTGTRGKTTTSNIIYQMLKEQGLKVYLAGNIPQKPAISLLAKAKKSDYVVLELSSWQLSGFHQEKISPHFAVFTNFYPDHLNYYSSMKSYFADKTAIFKYQKKNDFFVVNKSLKEKIAVRKIKSKIFFVDKDDFKKKLKYLKGDHNRENASLAFQVAKILRLNLKETLVSITNFKGVSYRQERIATKNNVIFINDTTSTTPIATIKAINSFSKNPVVLILGGKSKDLPFQGLISSLEKVNKIVLLRGTFTEEILPYLEKKYPKKISLVFSRLLPAIKNAYQKAKKLSKQYPKKEINLLFSPGATSFAMFRNEFHRGEEFNKIVKKIIQ